MTTKLFKEIQEEMKAENKIRKMIKLENMLIVGTLLAATTGAGIGITKIMQDKPKQGIIYDLTGAGIGFASLYGYSKVNNKRTKYVNEFYEGVKNDN